METLIRPSKKEIDDAVMEVLVSNSQGFRFADLARTVQARHGNIRSPYEVRKSAWRLIGSNRAQLGSGLRVRVK